MRYWWVNQNHAFRPEIEGGYLWSPKCIAVFTLPHILDTTCNVTADLAATALIARLGGSKAVAANATGDAAGTDSHAIGG